MQSGNLSKDKPKHGVYVSPVCDVIILETKGQVCTSANTTEQLQEEVFEW